jgi:ATP-binding cassette subfamily B protein
MSRLLGVVLTQRRELIIALSTSILGTVATLLVPIFEEAFVDGLSSHHAENGWLVGLIALALAAFGLAFLRRYFGGRLALGVQHYLRTRIFNHLQRIDFAAHDSLQTGQLVSEANADVSLIQGLLSFLPRLFGNALLALLSLVVMAVVYWPLALIVAVSLVIIGVASIRLRKQIFPVSLIAQKEKGAVNEVVEETVRGIAVVKGSALEDVQLNRLHDRATRLYRARVATIWRQAKLQAFLQLVPLVTEALVIGIGGYAAINGDLTIGAFLLFTTYIVELILPVRQLSVLVALSEQARAGVERIFGLLDTNPAIVQPANPYVPVAVQGTIEFEDVAFAYKPGVPVLDGLNLTIERGETVAVVGASGSGKSSLALLVPRFYEPQRGALTIDGVPVNQWDLTSLRQSIGIVFEESFLFSDTIRSNIALGRKDISDAEIVQAAEAAHADDFIRQLPLGYETVVGERGVRLSGGQRQRIALARALLGSPPILILDDATSSVDPATEAEILAAIGAAGSGRTMILIAHRRSTLHLADRIVLMQGGRILATGTHEQLLATEPAYRELMSGESDTIVETPRIALVAGDAPAPTQTKEESVTIPKMIDRRVELGWIDERFRFGSLFRLIRVGVVVGAVLVALDALLSLASPLVLRSGIDVGVLHHARSLVLAAALALGAVSVVDLVVVILEQVIAGLAAEKFLLLLRSRIFQKLLRLDMDYYETEMSGRIMTRMISDVDAFSNLVQNGLITALVSVVSFGLVLVVVIVIAPSIALVLVASLPLTIVASVIFQRYSNRAYTMARERIAAVNANFQEQVSGVRASRAKNRQGEAINRFDSLSSGYRDARMNAQKAISIYFPFLLMLADVTTALTLLYGGSQVLSHTLAVGTLLAATLYVNQFFSPIQQLSQTFDQFQQARVAARQIRRLMAQDISIHPTQNPVAVPMLRGDVAFRLVTFQYPQAGRPSLDSVSFDVPAGSRIAFVGETGAGKSTIAKLLVRFYDPTGGSITVDGIPLREVDLTSYRSQVAYLPQEPFLFTGTIAENVAFVRADATSAEVERACRMVGLGDFLDHHDEGVDYQIGDRGARLSAGQKQSVVLARLIVQDPRIVILDEVSSSLDLVAEAQMQTALDEVLVGRTTVVIAHRLSTLLQADQIYVLAQGKIVEQGTHDDLIGQGGQYASLWELSA